MCVPIAVITALAPASAMPAMPSPQEVIGAIKEIVPEGWIVGDSTMTNKDGVVWITIAGRKDHHVKWAERDGVIHRDVAGVEALRLGVSTNGNVQPRSLFRWLKGMNTPVVYNRDGLCVYAFESVVIDPAFRAKRRNAVWVYGEKGEPLSWQEWRHEVKSAVAVFMHERRRRGREQPTKLRSGR